MSLIYLNLVCRTVRLKSRLRELEKLLLHDTLGEDADAAVHFFEVQVLAEDLEDRAHLRVLRHKGLSEQSKHL
jgi:hypothetical protein